MSSSKGWDTALLVFVFLALPAVALVAEPCQHRFYSRKFARRVMGEVAWKWYSCTAEIAFQHADEPVRLLLRRPALPFLPVAHLPHHWEATVALPPHGDVGVEFRVERRDAMVRVLSSLVAGTDAILPPIVKDDVYLVLAPRSADDAGRITRLITPGVRAQLLGLGGLGGRSVYVTTHISDQAVTADLQLKAPPSPDLLVALYTRLFSLRRALAAATSEMTQE